MTTHLLILTKHRVTILEDVHIELVHAHIHHLHADPDIALTEHGAIEVDCEGTIRAPHPDVQVHQHLTLFHAVNHGRDPLYCQEQL